MMASLSMKSPTKKPGAMKYAADTAAITTTEDTPEKRMASFILLLLPEE